MTITERANRDRLTLHRGDELVIRLPAQAGTAYRWKLLQPAGECLQSQGEPGEQTKAQRPGGPVWQVFRYKAAESGTARLRFAYDSVADERGDSPSKRFEVTLVIPEP
jgi:predicted secreted protein